MRTLKTCVLLLILYIFMYETVYAQKTPTCKPPAVTSLAMTVSLNSDNSIDIPITVETECSETLMVLVEREVSEATMLCGAGISEAPTVIFDTTIRVVNASIGDEYVVLCGSQERGFNDGGCTVVVVP